MSELLSKATPTLRFPGFTEAWRISTLGVETSYTKGFAFKSTDYRKAGVRIIRVSDLAARHIKEDNDNIHVEKSRSAEFTKWEIKKGEIVITTVGSRPDLIESAVGRGIFVDRSNQGLLNQNMLKLESKHENAARFIFSQINTPRYTNYVAQIKRGNANQANITVQDLMGFRILIAAIPEQRKIADFFMAVDERIEQLTQKKALMEDYKKGVMQQLFTQAIRFKDRHGNDFPDWEEKKFGDIAEILNGFAFKSTSFSEDGVNKVIRMSDLKAGRIAEEDHASVGGEFVEGLERFALRDEDFLFGMSGSLANFAWVAAADLPAYLNQRVGCLRSKVDNVARFAHYLFLSQEVKKRIESNAVGAAQLNISSVFLKEMKLNIPSPNEQTKIAESISAIDRKIRCVITQIAETQTFKRGLLQQMFV